MSRNVRPAWIDVGIGDSDNGQDRKLSGGPKGRAGSLTARFKVRADGEAVTALIVDMIASADGSMVRMTITNAAGQVIKCEEWKQ